jgi:DNA-directed RNA polymerase III subunit RPC11
LNESLVNQSSIVTNSSPPPLVQFPHPHKKKQLVKEVALKKKEVDDVLGGEEAWKNVQKSQVPCPNCSHHEAYFREIQTRSADEPATIFYRCTSCAKTWKEG